MRKKQILSLGGLLLCLLLPAGGLTGCGAFDLTGAAITQNAQTLSSEESDPATAVPQTASVGSLTSENPMASAQPEEASDAVPTQTPEPEPVEVSIVMVGDILLHTPLEEAAKQEDGSYDFTALFANTREEIAAADLAIVNQEVIIGGEELGISGYPSFNAPYAIGDALVETGFDVICHATNHALDKGRKGLLNCLNFWKNNYPEVDVLGINSDEEEQETIYMYEKDGIRIAILNYTYGTNGIALPEDMPYGVNLLEEEKVIADIRRAEELADFTIVCPHWGTEYRLEPSATQRYWVELFLENGVDLVIGTHPHVIEPIEWEKDEETGQEMLIYYSLGNYANWTSGTGEGVAKRMVGGMAEVTLTLQEGKAVIADYGVEPLVCHLTPGINGVTVYRLSEYTEELAEENSIRLQDAVFSLDYCQELCRQIWGVE